MNAIEKAEILNILHEVSVKQLEVQETLQKMHKLLAGLHAVDKECGLE